MGMRLVVLGIVALAVLGWAESPIRGPIHINSVEDLLGLASGFGTVASPFVLEELRVDAAGEPFGILIANVHAPLVIRNIEVYGATVAAIRLQNVQNLHIENAVVYGSLTGVLLSGSKDVALRNITVKNCADGIRVMFSEGVVIEGVSVAKAEVGIWFQGVRLSRVMNSVIAECSLGLLFELESRGNVVARNSFLKNRIHAQSDGGNQFDDGECGNFWEGFVAKEGEAYVIGADFDRFPLLSPP